MTAPTELDELTLAVLAIVERTTVAEQRRRAVRAYTAVARADPVIARCVDLLAGARDDRAGVPGNVVDLAARRRL